MLRFRASSCSELLPSKDLVRRSRSGTGNDDIGPQNQYLQAGSDSLVFNVWSRCEATTGVERLSDHSEGVYSTEVVMRQIVEHFKGGQILADAHSGVRQETHDGLPIASSEDSSHILVLVSWRQSMDD